MATMAVHPVRRMYIHMFPTSSARLLPQEDNALEKGKRPGRPPRCLVLVPTRELAQQVQREFAQAAPTLACGVFYGGAPLFRI